MAKVRIVVYNNDLPPEVTERTIRCNVNLKDYIMEEGEEVVVDEAVLHALKDAVAIDYTQRKAPDGTVQTFQRKQARFIVTEIGNKNKLKMTNAERRIEESIVNTKSEETKPYETEDITESVKKDYTEENVTYAEDDNEL